MVFIDKLNNIFRYLLYAPFQQWYAYTSTTKDMRCTWYSPLEYADECVILCVLHWRRAKLKGWSIPGSFAVSSMTNTQEFIYEMEGARS